MNRMNVKICFAILLLASKIGSAQSNGDPCSRNQPVIAYNKHENAIFLFGGFCSRDKSRLNDLWKFDGKTWIHVPSNTPPSPRSGHSMIYDEFNRRLIVFGGKNDKGDLLNDLWVWDGNNWEMISEEGPQPRQSHRMAFNLNNGDVFLFGGSNADRESLNDTWVFRDEVWVELKPEQSPPARLQHTMSYDKERERIVLFGGFTRTENGKVVYGDTWEWESSEGWKLIKDNDQMARDHHAMSYDLKNKKTILFGGYNSGYLGDTWSWDGKEWMQLSTNGPSARAGKPGMVFDSNNEVIVLFGGWDTNNKPLVDFWQMDYQQQTWLEVK